MGMHARTHAHTHTHTHTHSYTHMRLNMHNLTHACTHTRARTSRSWGAAGTPACAWWWGSPCGCGGLRAPEGFGRMVGCRARGL